MGHTLWNGPTRIVPQQIIGLYIMGLSRFPPQANTYRHCFNFCICKICFLDEWTLPLNRDGRKLLWLHNKILDPIKRAVKIIYIIAYNHASRAAKKNIWCDREFRAIDPYVNIINLKIHTWVFNGITRNWKLINFKTRTMTKLHTSSP